MNRILLADHNLPLRSALALLLETRLGGQIVGQVSSMESLLCEANATRPEVVIMDWGLPGEPNSGRIKTLRTKTPHSRIIIVSARPEIASQATDADAFFCTTEPPEKLIRILKEN
jgi:DNA-binding NarL/FixJ family response regulator